MREETAVGIILTAGILISVAFKTYAGIALAALGIPLYLAYIAREQNILAKSRLYDRDLFLMIAIAVVVILVFNYWLLNRFLLWLVPNRFWFWLFFSNFFCF